MSESNDNPTATTARVDNNAGLEANLTNVNINQVTQAHAPILTNVSPPLPPYPMAPRQYKRKSYNQNVIGNELQTKVQRYEVSEKAGQSLI